MNSSQPINENQTVGIEVEQTQVAPTVSDTPIEQTTQVESIVELVLTKEEIITELKQTLKLPIEEIKSKVNELKQSFYQIHNAEQAAKRQIDQEEDAETPSEADPNDNSTELESQFKQLLQEFKQRKAELNAQLEKEREVNGLRKQQIIERMKELSADNADVSHNLSEFRQLQQAWKEVGVVAPSVNNDLWKQYNLCLENFYDLLKINQELREYDFKKNLEAKTQLCEAAEQLSELTDLVAAFRELQTLHDEWKTIGPVSRELRETIWARFQAASLVINKKHQDYFANLHQQEKKNLAEKQAMCEQIEAIDLAALTTYKQWEEKSQEVIEIQQKCRTIGFAARRENQLIYERYRALCDRFFAEKSQFYKKMKLSLAENLGKKRALCERAEALRDSTNWKEATEQFVQIQKEWKTIGAVPKKNSDDVWKRFVTACDYFFEQKKASASDHKNVEQQNLQAKIAIIEQIEAYIPAVAADSALADLKELAAKFNAVGFVPFKEKDKIYKRFREAMDKHFDALNIDAMHRRLDNFKSNLQDMETQGESKLLSERRRLLRIYDGLKSEIATSENNLGFFSAKSKKSAGLLKDMEYKIEQQRKELALVEQKINMIDVKLYG